MATAVLHAQDYLAAPPRDQNSRFFTSAEHPYPAASSNGGAFTPAFTPLSESLGPPVTGHGRDAALCSKVHNRRGSYLSRNNSAVRILSSPARLSAHSTHQRVVPRNSVVGVTETLHSYHGRQRLSLHGSEMRISRQHSVPMLDHATHAQRSLSERLHLRGEQLHERRPLQHDARFPSSPAQNMPSRMGGTPVSCQKLRLSASSHFQDMLALKRADSFVPSAHYRKRLHPEASQVEADWQYGKPAVKVLAGWPERSICTSMSIASGKHLSRSTSDKVWERLETQMPADKVGKKIDTSLSDEVAGVHTGKRGSCKSVLNLTSFEPPVLSLGRKKEKGPQVQLYVDLKAQGLRVGMVRSVHERTLGAKEYGGASLPSQCCGDIKAFIEHKVVNRGDTAAIEGFTAPVMTDGGKVGKTSNSNKSDGSNARRFESAIRSEGILGGHRSILDTNEIWVSMMMKDEKWAGPLFFSSPPPSALPVPSFTFLLSKAPSAGLKSSNGAGGFGALTVPNKSSLQASSHTWDAAFATEDLRRMLHLDNTVFISGSC